MSDAVLRDGEQRVDAPASERSAFGVEEYQLAVDVAGPRRG